MGRCDQPNIDKRKIARKATKVLLALEETEAEHLRKISEAKTRKRLQNRNENASILSNIQYKELMMQSKMVKSVKKTIKQSDSRESNNFRQISLDFKK